MGWPLSGCVAHHPLWVPLQLGVVVQNLWQQIPLKESRPWLVACHAESVLQLIPGGAPRDTELSIHWDWHRDDKL